MITVPVDFAVIKLAGWVGALAVFITQLLDALSLVRCADKHFALVLALFLPFLSFGACCALGLYTL